MRILAKIAYDGSAFCGFAPQKNIHTMSVYNKLEEILQSIGIDSKILAAGRTDKGVHASAQMISFDVVRKWDLTHLGKILNYKGYPHIYFLNLRYVSDDFHPRFHARWRSYRYLLSLKQPNPFMARYVGFEHCGRFDYMQEALQCFIGKHNFTLFKKQGSLSKDDVREIYQSYAYCYKNLIIIHIRANGFLRSQVRLMLGAAFSYGRGELSKDDLLAQIYNQKQSYTLPISPNGLYLCGVGFTRL